MGKQRLTITLSESVLKKVDHYIDGIKIRNRSHAIENLLENSFSPGIDTAVILAGGAKHLSDTPTLKKIGDRYLLAIMLEQLRDVGIAKVVLCAGAVGSEIEKVFGDGSQMGLEIVYATEKTPLGTAGALKNAQKHIDAEAFFVIHGDVLCDLDLEALISFHLAENTIATMVVKPALGTSDYGQVVLEGNKIVQFLPSSEDKGISIINTGIYVVKSELLQLIPNVTPLFLEKDIFPLLSRKRELSAFVFQGFWYDVTSTETYSAAAKQWEE